MRPALARLCLLALCLLTALPAAADGDGDDKLPQFPKVRPPSPLPETTCDASRPGGGDWLVGRWVGPQTVLSFSRGANSLAWVLDRKSAAGEFGWAAGGTIEGIVVAATACTVRLTAGPDGAFVFEGVLTEEGRLYGYAVNKAGADVRFTLRREK
jgi:hypothetical protein